MKKLVKKTLAITGCVALVLLTLGCVVQSLLKSVSIPSDSGLVDSDNDGATDYAVLGLDESIQYVFEESIDPNSFDQSTDLVVSPEESFDFVFTTTTHENDTLVLTPEEGYTAGQVYSITLVGSSLQSVNASSERRLSAVERQFQAADKTADTTYPYVVSLDPADEATDVACDATLTGEFSEQIMAIRVYAKSGTPELPSDLAIDGSADPVITVTTTEGFTANTTYTIVIDPLGGAASIGTIDHVGNRLVANAGSSTPAQVEWTFTTGDCL